MPKQNKKPAKTIHKGLEPLEMLKEELLEVADKEKLYDEIFERKLSNDYFSFRETKEYKMQSEKFFRILAIIVTVILVALLLLSFP
jgi:hypothetical protein